MGTEISPLNRIVASVAGPAAADQVTESPAELALLALNKLFVIAPRLSGLIEYGSDEHGITPARGRVLWALRGSGPMKMRELSTALDVTPRTITGLVDALEADGWVERTPHPTDRRATVIRLTPAAEVTCTKLDESYRSLARSLFEHTDTADLRAFVSVLRYVDGRLAEVVRETLGTLEREP